MKTEKNSNDDDDDGVVDIESKEEKNVDRSLFMILIFSFANL